MEFADDVSAHGLDIGKNLRYVANKKSSMAGDDNLCIDTVLVLGILVCVCVCLEYIYIYSYIIRTLCMHIPKVCVESITTSHLLFDSHQRSVEQSIKKYC